MSTVPESIAAGDGAESEVQSFSSAMLDGTRVNDSRMESLQISWKRRQTRLIYGIASVAACEKSTVH